jgi:cell division protein FtsW (lipid II flippase)
MGSLDVGLKIFLLQILHYLSSQNTKKNKQLFPLFTSCYMPLLLTLHRPDLSNVSLKGLSPAEIFL